MLMGSLMMEEKQLDFNRPLISVRRPAQTSESESKTRSYDSVTNKVLPSLPVYKSDIKSGPVRIPGTVPFQWEHMPGKPKDESKPVLLSTVEPHFVPKLPPGRKRIELGTKPETRADHQTKAASNNVSSSSSSSDKYHVEDAKSYSSRYDDYDSDGTYLDATDTLSRSESFFYNCSNVSGVSGLDGSGILVEPFGTLSSDRQTQDLMMGRFLPAAKALTSETPPHLARKPPKPEEPAKQLMKKAVLVKEKQNKVEQNPYRFHHSVDQEEEEDENTSSMASGVCGLVPQLCLRSSLGLLNPIPSVRMQAQKAVSVRRMRSKYQDPAPSNESQNKQINEDKRKLKLNGSVVQVPSQGETFSVSSIPQGKEKPENFDTASRAKVSKNFGELLASDDNTWEPSSETPVAEKTLYVDTVHSVSKKVQEETKKQSLPKEYPSLDIVPVKDVQNLIEVDEKAVITQPKSTEEMNDDKDEDFTKFSSQKVEECLDQAIVALPESNVVEITKEKIDLENQLQGITTNSRLHHRSSYHIVPPPPLPKAPSDSWLKRTLPTIPPKTNSFAWLQSLGDDDHFTKVQTNPKWETMVKTSNTQQGFVCFSKETLNTIPEA
ncbi:hypothetical protein CARUB_v10022845mg [Capsella rubella]|uniref:Uncharacterized protein n=1 Tax=Capsella rubella TaxID=81985 RepID=R0HND5_9BRAS|nr:uncharacterized protein LOC17889580 [Capsella rubella]XP_023640479.1 uncharacterized protein LOC17889580 [Capsella rubella]XP_023640480.1 uncharacterized protein LOC17889580 [Capsella rubella]XP_023640481.1 uncharacterized protein LOC17889580 [Capsella rubella]EOA26760.1 hypothetical protein CARUB_v10022845mg [Capsella rubella]